MTTANTATAPRILAAGTEQTTNTLAAKLGRAWGRNQAYRATLADLRALTDRQLGDVGLTRGMLKETARRAVYGN